MNKHFKQIFSKTRYLLTLVFLCCFLITSPSAAAETTITNSISVSANSSGESHAAVTTIINGEVVEDWSSTSTEPIVYSESFSTTSETSVKTDLKTNTKEELEAIISHLQALISMYVSLLKH